MPRIILILVLSVLLLIPVYIAVTKLVQKINAWMNDITNWDCTVQDIKDQKHKLSQSLDDELDDLSAKAEQNAKRRDELKTL
jgi:predicted PurR-regulated permease PerM